MACPFFYPTDRLDQTLWSHPRRLPLGGGFAGICRARGGEEYRPLEFSQLDCCNLGYAAAGGCDRFPGDGAAEAVRFTVMRDADGLVAIQYVVERGYLPHEHGMLEYDRERGAFRNVPENAVLARQVHVYIESYESQKRKRIAVGAL